MTQVSHLRTVGIVGGGVSGLAAAIAFARIGYDVTVFEKHASMAALGAGVLIQPQGLAALDELGGARNFRDVSVPVTGLLGTCHRNWTLVDIGYGQTEARGVSRLALLQVLLDAALRLGVRIEYESPVTQVAHTHVDASVRTGRIIYAFERCSG
jgi:2-polyprenyl-6-methoxyphenol hydroxylase-like FAD-dependent oxidoreductase